MDRLARRQRPACVLQEGRYARVIDLIAAVVAGSIDLSNDTITVVRRADRWGRIGHPKSKAGTRTTMQSAR